RTFRVKLQVTGSLDAVRLGMTGDAALLPIGTDVAADATRGANAVGAVNSAGATNASRAATTHAGSAPATAAPTTHADGPPPAAAAAEAPTHRPNIPQVAATQPQAGAQ